MKPAHAMQLETRRRAARGRLVEPDGSEDADSSAALKKPVRAEKEAKMSKEIAEKVAKLQSKEAIGGYYELNALMSNALEGELQNIMNEVWNELPESPPSDTEKMVTGKFKTEVGDNLKNALGLNVSKRILNVTNSLYVKIEFDRKPFGLSIQNFVRWLNCATMKRVLDGQHNYVALLIRQADFDRVTSKKTMSIGGLSATISPYYKFTKCPPRLKTIYKVKYPETTENDEKTTKTENSTEENTDANKTCKDSDKKTSEAATVVAKTPVPVSEAAPVTKTALLSKMAPVSKTASVSNTSPDSKPAPVSKTENTKPVEETPKKAAQTTEKVVPKVVAKTPANTTPAKPNVVKTTPTKPNVVKTTPTKPNVVKTTPTKAATAPVKVVAKTVQASPSTKEPKAAEKAQVTTKPVNKSNTTKQPAAKAAPNKTDKNKQKNKSDFDELNDEDILALMSNAIVLDECSGSEEE